MALPKMIAVIHLPALAGSPAAPHELPNHTLQTAGALAIKEAKALEKAGFDGLILENYGDSPFLKNNVSTETLISMSLIATAVKQSVKCRVGINLLRNDTLGAFDVASITGCDFIRVNILSGIYATDQGLIEGQAAELLRKRSSSRSPVKILADVFVKHATPLHNPSLKDAISELTERAGADGVIITGSSTGSAADIEILTEAKSILKNSKVPLYVGSGLTPENFQDYSKVFNGFIVGSTLRTNSKAGNPLSTPKIKKFTSKMKQKKQNLKRKNAPKKKAKKRN